MAELQDEPPLVPGLQPTSARTAKSIKKPEVTKPVATSSVVKPTVAAPAPSGDNSRQPGETSRRQKAHTASLSSMLGGGYITFYPCGDEERAEEGPPLAKGKPQPCSSQCTSHTERLQLAALDLLSGVSPSFLSESEQTFLNAARRDERKRLFSLTEQERAVLDGACLTEGDITRLPSLPTTTPPKRMLQHSLSDPVEHPLDTSEILLSTLSRYFRWV